MSRKLYRSTKDRMLGGVAGGLGEYFEIDSTLIRILFVITLFLGGTGIFAYILLWIVVPEYPYYAQQSQNTASDADLSSSAGINQSGSGQPRPESDVENYLLIQEERKKKRIVFGGIVLILIGLVFLADNFIPHFSASDLLPLLIVAVGIGILINATKKKQ